MGRYFIHLAYNGANYRGWQTQPGLPTVQQTLEAALSTLLRQKIDVVGCGRTDTGVHASDFYAHFSLTPQPPLLEREGEEVRDNTPLLEREGEEARDNTPLLEREGEEERNNTPLLEREGEEEREGVRPLVFKLNSLLPPDIVIYDIFPVADNAHARYDAVARTYQYHVSDLRLPFRQGQYCRIYYKPDLDKMNEAARMLMQYDDFTSFAKLHTQVKTNICHLTEAHWDLVPVRSSEFGVRSSELSAEPTAYHSGQCATQDGGSPPEGENPSAQCGSDVSSQWPVASGQCATQDGGSPLNTKHLTLNTNEYEWVFTIRSNRFLRNMVRSVTGTLLDVGRGKLSLEGLREIIEKKDRCAAGVSMPACGLFLTKVDYPWQL